MPPLSFLFLSRSMFCDVGHCVMSSSVSKRSVYTTANTSPWKHVQISWLNTARTYSRNEGSVGMYKLFLLVLYNIGRSQSAYSVLVFHLKVT